MRTRKSVTRRAILPGTTSGLIRKLTQLVTTNMKLGRYTWAQRGDEHSVKVSAPGHLYLVLHLLPLQVDLEAAGGVVAGGEVHHLVLLRQGLDADVVGEAALPLGVVQELGGADDCLGRVVIWGVNVNQGWNFD